MHAIGIDIGTTSICGVLLDVSDGKILKQQTIASEAFITTENSWEKIQDVNKILSIARKILDELLSPEVLAIGLTGQMHGILYTDKEGVAISPLYTWQDERGNQPYKETTYAAYLGSYTGYGNVTDFYNRINGLRPKEAASYCTIQDYLGMVLCGLKKPVIHKSNAASFGCFEPKTCEFRDAVNVERIGVMSTCLGGDERKSFGPDGEITGDYRIIGKYQNIPVSVAIGDNQASVFSTMADENGILVNVGTGSQITVVSDDVIEGAGLESRPYVEGKYLVVGAALCGGRAYSILKDFYAKILNAAGTDMLYEGAGMRHGTEDGTRSGTEAGALDIYGLMEKLMEEDSALPGLKVDTRFAGTREEPTIRGSITGISEENFTPGALAKGVLAGMAEELYHMYCRMNVSRGGLIGSGNGIRKNRRLMEVMENYFGEKMKIPAHKEEAAYGAALFALVACGKFRNAADARKLICYKD